MINLVINDFVGDAAFTGFDEACPLKKHYEWQTDLVRYDNRKEQRNQILAQPVRHWFINWQIMDQAARNKLIELFQRAKGRYDTFLCEDSDDYACALTDWSYTAAGGETEVQLQKTYYIGETEAWTEDKTKIQPGTIYAPTVKIDAAVKTEGVDYTLDDTTGIIDFSAGSGPNGPLGAGEVVTAAYYFYFEVRFHYDVHEDFMPLTDLWQAKNLHIVEVIT